MKYLMFLLVAFTIPQAFHAQSTTAFMDSLTLDNQRTWVTEHGPKFTAIGEGCEAYEGGVEMIFHENGMVDMFVCEDGIWEKQNYMFDVIEQDEEYFINAYHWKEYFFFLKKKVLVEDFRMQIQLFAKANGKSFATINLFRYNSKSTIELNGQ